VTSMTERLSQRPLSLIVLHDENSTTVVPSGVLDLGTAHVLEREVRQARELRRGGVVVDLSRLTFVDSTGLRLLVSFRDEARRTGQRFALKPGNGWVERVFEISGTRPLFDWEEAS